MFGDTKEIVGVRCASTWEAACKYKNQVLDKWRNVQSTAGHIITGHIIGFLLTLVLCAKMNKW